MGVKERRDKERRDKERREIKLERDSRKRKRKDLSSI
jgi:hypothetical protein